MITIRIRTRSLRIALILASLAAAVASRAAGAAESRTVTIPGGTYLELKTESEVDSETASKGDTFLARAPRGLWIEGQLAVPAGSTVRGTIKTVRSVREGALSAAVNLKFETLQVAGRTYDLEGELVTLKADERRRLLEQACRVATDGKTSVILIGSGTEADMKADTLAGRNIDGHDLAADWAKSGLGPPRVRLVPGTELTMRFEKAITVEAASGARGVEDRNLYVSSGTIKAAQQVLRDRRLYTGPISGELDQATRDALARFQLEQNQPATGDADEATLRALGVLR